MAIAYGLIEPVELHLPTLPRNLEGLRIAHLSDLHIRRNARPYQRLEAQLTTQRLDLIAFTGDYMNWPNRDEEPHVHAVLQRLCRQLRPRLGAFGVFGNHDTALLRERCADLPVRWLRNQATRLDARPIEILGLDMVYTEWPDAVALAAHLAKLGDPPPLQADERPFRLMLAHVPTGLPTAADLGADLMLSGHTHGGQCRLPTGHALVNACDMPLRLTSGLLRHRNTLAGVSRGIGFAGSIPRICCKPHVPVYTLRRGTLPGAYTDTIENLRPW